MTDDVMSTSRTIAAPAEAIFDRLADPAAHAAIDGTGWVRDPVDPEPLAAAGQVFRIGMFHANHPAGAYEMANRVEVFDRPRAISWLPGQEDGSGTIGYGGWTWRYDLEPAGSGGTGPTTVTLTYDWSAVPAALREHIRFPPFGPEHLANSLAHLDGLVTSG